MTWLDEESCVQHSALALEMIGQDFIHTYTMYRFVKKKNNNKFKASFLKCKCIHPEPLKKWTMGDGIECEFMNMG